MTAPTAVLAAVAVLLAGSACGSQPSDMERAVRVTRGVAFMESARLDVFSPSVPSRTGAPVVVTLHGCCGSGEDLFQLAYGLAEAGAVVFNPSWRSLPDGGGYPEAYEQAACAIAFARVRAAEHGGDARRVTVVGWSDGALLGGVAANGGARCAGQNGHAAVPDAFVAVGGFLGWPVAGDGRVDPRYVNEGTVRWFGGRPEAAPDAWAAGNPYAGLGRNPHVAIRLVVGRDDALLADNRRFLEAALGAGLDASLTVAEDAGDQTVVAPRTREGKLTVRTILEAAR
jgi:acetyl esterase/lipase